MTPSLSDDLRALALKWNGFEDGSLELVRRAAELALVQREEYVLALEAENRRLRDVLEWCHQWATDSDARKRTHDALAASNVRDLTHQPIVRALAPGRGER